MAGRIDGRGGVRHARGLRMVFGTILSIALALIAMASLAATNPGEASASPYEVLVGLGGNGSGAVISAEPEGAINCRSGSSTGCIANLESGTRVSLDPEADPDSVFTGWSGVSSRSLCAAITFSHPQRCSFTVRDSGVALIANFARVVPGSFPLAVFKEGNGFGTITSDPPGIECGPGCEEEVRNFTRDTVVTLTAQPAESSRFVDWGNRGACIDVEATVTTCTVTMSEARSVFPQFTLKRHELSVGRIGAGTGTVTSSPEGIDCGIACIAEFNHGQSVELTATPGPGSSFGSWASGPCQGTSAPTCDVTMDQARTVLASFNSAGPDRHTLDVSMVGDDGDGEGTVTSHPAGINCDPSGSTCSADFDHNETVTLTATANPGSAFAGWGGETGGACTFVPVTGDATCVLRMDRARAVDAHFVDNSDPATSPLTVLLGGTGYGNVKSVPSEIDCGNMPAALPCSGQFPKDATVTLTATPSTMPGSRFAGWSGACQGDGTCVVKMDKARTVRAIFTGVTSGIEMLTVIRTGDGYGHVDSIPSGISCGDACSAGFSGGERVTLKAAADAGSVFTGWNGACEGSGTTCVVKMEKARTVWASFSSYDPNDPDGKAPLVVFRTGDGAGRVTSDLPGIDCGSECDARYDRGATVELTANPEPGSTFAGWNGACQHARATCEVKMDKARSVWAAFNVDDPNQPRLTAFKAGDGNGDITSDPTGIDCGNRCTAPFDRDRTVTLTAAPDSESVFAGWNGACQGTGTTCVVKMDKARTVWASFSVNDYPRPRLNVFRAGQGEGRVTSSPPGIECGNDCQASFNRGQTVTLTATPDTGSAFTGWSGSGCDGTGTCTVTMDQARSVWAVFSPDGGGTPGADRQLIVVKTGNGNGTVTSDPAGIDCGSDCIADFEHRATVTLTAEAGADSSFAGWTGACSGSAPTCEVKMDKAELVGANFRVYDVNTPPLTVFKGGNGDGTVTSDPAGIDCGTDCDAEFSHGTTVTLTATPATGSDFNGWTGACSGAAETCEVEMDRARMVGANFSVQPPPVKHTLTVTKSTGGQGTVTSDPDGINCGAECKAEFDDGTTVTLTATAASGSKFTGWSGACTGTEATCVVTMDEARTVTASFAKAGKPVPDNPPNDSTAIYNPATGKLKIRLKCARHYRPKCIRMVAWGVGGKKKKAKQFTNRIRVKNRKAGVWKYATLTVKPKFRQKVRNMGKKAHKTLWVRIKVTFRKKKKVKVRRNGKVRKVKRKVKMTKIIHHRYRVRVKE